MFQVILTVSQATFKKCGAYRFNIAISLIAGPVYFIANYSIWTSIYANSNKIIAGFSLSQILTYYAITTMLGYLIYDTVDSTLNRLIRSGNIMQFLLRPISYMVYAFSEKIGSKILVFLVEVTPVYLLLSAFFNVRLTPANYIFSILSICMSFCIMFLLNFIIGCLAFWFTRSGGLSRVMGLVKSLLTGFLIPLSFFPETIQKILYFLPFQYIAYVPTRVFIGSYQLAGKNQTLPSILLTQFFILISMLLLAIFTWNSGIKKLSGVGV